jgi:hypothetical protein
MVATDELDALEYFATRMGVELDRDQVRRTRISVKRLIAQAEHRANETGEPSHLPEQSKPLASEAAASREIAALFAHLAED